MSLVQATTDLNNVQELLQLATAQQRQLCCSQWPVLLEEGAVCLLITAIYLNHLFFFQAISIISGACTALQG